MKDTYADDELKFGLGVGVPFAQDTWEARVEAYGGAVVSGIARQTVGADTFSKRHTPAELLASMQWTPTDKPLWLAFGAGPGLTNGYGTPDFRAFVELGLGMMGTPKVKPEPVVEQPPAPPADSDNDGVVDTQDACPADPEDRDRFEDTDGCPDLDNDKDGVPDVSDGHVSALGVLTQAMGLEGFGDCLNQPEDKDAFEDTDGCSDPDNDKDGIFDAVDGHRDAAGAVAMAGVNGDCANEPEVKNGVDDADGCPDVAKATVTEKEIKVDPIYFDYGKYTVRKDSLAVLDAVVTILQSYPSIKKVEIQGHTDSRGSDVFNLDLSQHRVDAAREYIISKGIAAERLVSKGYGETMPVVPGATTEEQHQLNRRVLFIILEKGEDVPTVK